MPTAEPSPQSGYSLWRWWICIILLLASTINYLDRQALNQTSKRIQASFNLDDNDYGTIESIFVIGFAIGTLFAGWLVDRVGVRWVYPCTVLLWSLFGFMTGYASMVWMLFFFRFGLGFFEAGNWPCGIRTVRQIMPARERALGNAFFQNGTALGAILTPPIVLLCIQYSGPTNPDAWKLPFRVIGIIGLFWVALWFLTIPSRVFTQGETETAKGPATSFWLIFRDRRFWILIVVIIAVNTSWHTFRVWLPKFLEQQHGYNEQEKQWYTMVYYIFADVGAWAVGLTIFLLARKFTVQTSRMICFSVCTLIVLAALALPFANKGPVLLGIVFVFGFGAFGLFPVYFALSQELSSRHQGKVTGTLGCINSLYLAGMYKFQGYMADQLNAGTLATEARRYDQIMFLSGVPALIALIVLLLFWPKTKTEKV